MSTRDEIVRYRANLEAVFSLTYDESVLGQENYLNGVKKNQPRIQGCGILTSAL
jgi:hypothetical protein